MTRSPALLRLALMLIPLLAAAVFGRGQSDPSPVAGDAGIEVVLISDLRTWVSIERVKVPQQFERATFRLAPGNYEIVGRRKGYRDVYKKLTVPSSEAQAPITIICTETVR